MGELVVEKIENGTVIDHIPGGMGAKVLAILGAGEGMKTALLMNVRSKTGGKKDILKISDKQLTAKEVSKISLVAPNATLNIIKNSNVSEKKSVHPPDELVGVAKCPNPKCITNTNEKVDTRFIRESSKFRCAYCEMPFDAKELVI